MDAIGKLAGGVAHDFNNLLTAILGFGDAAARQLRARRPAPRAGRADPPGRASGPPISPRNCSPSAASSCVQPIVVNLKSVVDDSRGLLRRLIGENIQPATRSHARSLRTVRVDPGQFEQILMNLAINARDAMPEGGRLTIEVSNVELDEAYVRQHVAVAAGPYVMLAVSDTGVGMSEAVRTRLFEPFFTTKKRGEGTGLGLATVYGAVKQSGGYVWVYSEPGPAARSRSTCLALLMTRRRSRPRRRSSKPEKGTETIMLVEDEDGVRLLTRMILERAGYRVILAASAEEAEQHAPAIRWIDRVC